jgi:thiol:disulfide interchange protein DsbG
VSALTLAVALAACSKQETPSAAASPAPAPTTAPATAPTDAAPATTAQAGTNAAPAAPAATAATAVTAAKTSYDIAAQGKGFSVGPMMAAQVVYVFFDPACPHCAHLWQGAQQLGTKLRMVWMPVGFLRPQSTPQGATILAAADPVAAMNTNEASVLQRGPGIPADPKVPDAVVQQVKANTDLLKQLNADSVPFIVFKNAKTGQAGTHAGAVPPDELLQMVGM